MAIDHLGRTVFWTDSVKDRIEVASLDGSQRRVLVDSGLVNPRAIITDPPSGCVSEGNPAWVGEGYATLVQLQSAQANWALALSTTAICTGPTGTAMRPRSRPLTWTGPTGGFWSKTSWACPTA